MTARINTKSREIIEVKDKSTGVILAVFLSFWAWLYTYKMDKSKFWAGLIIVCFSWILLFIPALVVWIWAIVDMSTKPKDMYVNYSKWKVK